MALHSIKPKVSLNVTTDNPCRLMNKLGACNIQAENVVYNSEGISLTIEACDFKKARKVISKNRAKSKIAEKKGLYFKLYKIKNLKSYILSVIIFMALIYMVSLHLWNISFEGNLTITNEQLDTFLKSKSITTGMYKRKINCNQLEKDIRSEYFEVTWVCAEIKGTNLIVHIKENYNKEIAVEEKEPYNLVAKHNSVVKSIVTRSGVPQVIAGSVVKEGDVLISGTIDVYNEFEEKLFTNHVNADGDIWGETTFAYKDEFKLKYDKKIYLDKEADRYYVDAFSYKIGGFSSDSANSYEIYDNYQSIKLLGNFYIPIKVGMIKRVYYKTEEAVYTKTEAKDLARENLQHFLIKLQQKGMQILEKNVNIDINDKRCQTTGTITVLERLGKVSPIVYQEEGTTAANERN